MHTQTFKMQVLNVEYFYDFNFCVKEEDTRKIHSVPEKAC